MSAPSSLNGKYLKSGIWDEVFSYETGYQNHEFAGYNYGQGTWRSSLDGGYSGFWFSSDSDINYGGIIWGGSAVCVIDANKNNFFDSSDYVAGYAYGNDGGSNENEGFWERNANQPYGTFDGEYFGLFEITIPIDYVGNKNKDNVLGSKSDDFIQTSGGDDNLYGGTGNDNLYGGAGKDTALFSSRANCINLNITKRQNTHDGRDILKGIENVKGGNGNDLIKGNNLTNYLYGENGKDSLYGRDGKDKLFGGKGNDKLFGEAGNDILFGDNGNDILTGGLGNDQLTGGSGKDKFCISTGTGRDVIKDYGTGNDLIKLLNGLTESDLKINQAGDNVKIKYEGDLMAIVQDTLIADLTFI